MMQAVRDIRDEVELLDKDLVGTKLTKVQYVLNQREYAVPSNFFEAIKVEVTDLGGPPYPTLSPIDFEEVGAIIGTAGFIPGITGASIGEPVYYYFRELEIGDTPIGGVGAVTVPTMVIGFDPIPSRNAATTNVNIWSVWASAQISAIDMVTSPDPNPVLDLPTSLHDLVPHRMCINAAVTSDPGLVTAFQDMYNSKLGIKLMALAQGLASNPPRVHIVDSW